MQDRRWNPEGVPKPFGRYHQAVLTPAPAQLLLLSGQIGIAADGTIPEDVAEQARLTFQAIDRCLEEAGMTRRHVLKLTTYLTDIDDRAAVMAVRDAWVDGPAPASTLLAVKALATPALKVEIEAIAGA